MCGEMCGKSTVACAPWGFRRRQTTASFHPATKKLRDVSHLWRIPTSSEADSSIAIPRSVIHVVEGGCEGIESSRTWRYTGINMLTTISQHLHLISPFTLQIHAEAKFSFAKEQRFAQRPINGNLAPLLALSDELGGKPVRGGDDVHVSHGISISVGSAGPTVRQLRQSTGITHAGAWTGDLCASPSPHVNTNTHTSFRDDFYPTHATMADQLSSPHSRSSPMRQGGHRAMSTMSTTDPRQQNLVSCRLLASSAIPPASGNHSQLPHGANIAWSLPPNRSPPQTSALATTTRTPCTPFQPASSRSCPGAATTCSPSKKIPPGPQRRSHRNPGPSPHASKPKVCCP